MKNAKPITRDLIQACREDYENSRLSQAMTCAVSKTDLENAAFDGEAA